MNGTIKSVNMDKGYGFIKGEDGKEYFFHRSALKNCSLGDMEDGREVTFEEAESDKGLRAEDIYV
jgi:cold shock CspA family protein